MRTGLLICVVLTLAVVTGHSQNTYYSVFKYDGAVPDVSVQDRSAELQASLFPDLYQQRSARRDMLWVQRHDSSIVAFWREQGTRMLHILRELSGLEWQEKEFALYLVRQFPSVGSSDPLILPLGGVGDGDVIEAAPEGSRFVLNLTYQLARRMLAQAVQPEKSVHHPVAQHPLWRSGPNRFDNLAMILALATCQNVIGIDSTYDAYQCAFWRHHHPGRVIFDKYYFNQWQLSPDRPLVDWVTAEQYNSELVRVTRPPRRSTSTTASTKLVHIEGLPLTGDFGFAVTFDASGRLIVGKIDVERLAYACGLREGDRIYRANGTRPRSHRDLVEKLFAGLDATGSVVLQVIREGQTIVVLIQPFEMIDDANWPGADDDTLSPMPPLYQPFEN